MITNVSLSSPSLLYPAVTRSRQISGDTPDAMVTHRRALHPAVTRVVGLDGRLHPVLIEVPQTLQKRVAPGRRLTRIAERALCRLGHAPRDLAAVDAAQPPGAHHDAPVHDHRLHI